VNADRMQVSFFLCFSVPLQRREDEELGAISTASKRKYKWERHRDQTTSYDLFKTTKLQFKVGSEV